MHCGGQTFAQMLHDVQRTLPSSVVVDEHRQHAEPLVDGQALVGVLDGEEPLRLRVLQDGRLLAAPLGAEPEVEPLMAAAVPAQGPTRPDEERAEEAPQRDEVADEQPFSEAHRMGPWSIGPGVRSSSASWSSR